MTARRLNEAEQRVWAAFPRGEWVDLRTGDPDKDDVTNAPGWDDDRVVRAEVIAELLLGAVPPDPGRRPGVRLRGARVEGRLSLENATVQGPAGDKDALSLSRATIGGGLIATGLSVRGRTALRDARVGGEARFNSAVLSNPGGVALSGVGLTVEGPFFALHGFVAVGEVRLPGAHIRTFLTIPGASLSAPGGVALSLDQVTVDDVDATDLTVTGGRVSLVGTRVGSDLTLCGARLDGEDIALAADNITVGGTFDCSRLRARGEVRATVGRIAGRLLLRNADLAKPGGVTCLRLSRTEIGADLFCSGLRAHGRVRLAGTRVGAQVDLSGARLANPGGNAFEGRTLQAGELILRPAEPIDGRVVLEHARIGVVHDDPRTWPAEMSLNGLTYESLEPRLPASERLRWLALDPDGHQPQPYERLAAHYTTMGQHSEARRIMLTKERLRHASGSPTGNLWGLVQEATVAYGYQPWRAVLWLALLVTAGSLVYGTQPPAPLKPDEAPHFNPVVYTLDLLLPLVDLGQERAFNPAGGYQWLSFALVAAGWILVTVIAAAVARVLTRR